MTENYRGKSAWQKYRADAKARGAKLDLAELLSPPIPEEENFAAAPTVRGFLSLDPKIRAPLEEAVRLPERNLYEAELQPSKGRRGERTDLVGWQQFFVAHSYLSGSGESAGADVIKAMERYEPILSAFREAAKRPRSRLNGSSQPGHHLDTYRLGDPLPLARLLSLRVAALIELRQSTDAMDDCRVQYRLSELYQSQTTLLGAMLRVSLASEALNNVWEGLATHCWKNEELEEQERLLSKVDLIEDYIFALWGETAFINSLVDRWLDTSWQHRPEVLAEDIGGRGTHPPARWLLIPAGWYDQNRVRVNQWFDRQVQAAIEVKTNPYARRMIAWRVSSEGLKNPGPYWRLLQAMEYKTKDPHPLFRATQAEVQLCRVACALERFRIREAKYPDNLAALVPIDLAQMPLDEFSAKPLFYERNGDEGLLLYSVGANGRDEAGAGDDLVWRVPTSSTRN